MNKQAKKHKCDNQYFVTTKEGVSPRLKDANNVMRQPLGEQGACRGSGYKCSLTEMLLLKLQFLRDEACI